VGGAGGGGGVAPDAGADATRQRRERGPLACLLVGGGKPASVALVALARHGARARPRSPPRKRKRERLLRNAPRSEQKGTAAPVQRGAREGADRGEAPACGVGGGRRGDARDVGASRPVGQLCGGRRRRRRRRRAAPAAGVSAGATARGAPRGGGCSERACSNIGASAPPRELRLSDARPPLLHLLHLHLHAAHVPPPPGLARPLPGGLRRRARRWSHWQGRARLGGIGPCRARLRIQTKSN